MTTSSRNSNTAVKTRPTTGTTTTACYTMILLVSVLALQVQAAATRQGAAFVSSSFHHAASIKSTTAGRLRSAVMHSGEIHSPFEVPDVADMDMINPFQEERTTWQQRPKPRLLPKMKTRGAPKEASLDTTTDMQTANTVQQSQEQPVVNVDAMRARAAVLRRSILQQQKELQQLERQIICCSSSDSGLFDLARSPLSILKWHSMQTMSTFKTSTNVLVRKLDRVQGQIGVNNQQWQGSVRNFVAAQTNSGVRIMDKVFRNQTQLLQIFIDPSVPSLAPHLPAILARLDRLEHHVPPILEKVLNNQRHLASIEPYLDDILERFDDIEPHLPWILEHVDVLAPYTGLLLKHIDELL